MGLMDLPIDEVLSEALRLEIVHDLGNFTVALFGSIESAEEARLYFAGSGTLVAVEDRDYILTAAHVWSTLREYPLIGITSQRENQQDRCLMETSAIADITIGPEKPEKWGPDLSFLRVPPLYAAKLRTNRAFYNLLKIRRIQPDHDHIETWVVMGAPAVYGQFSAKHADLTIAGFFSLVEQGHERNGFDYLDLGVAMVQPDVPSTFGGISGGGLWKVLVFEAEEGQYKWLRSIQGVVFYQTEVAAGRRFVRSHGRRSIYETLGIKEPALPT